MKTIPSQRELAIKWWNSISSTNKHHYADKYYESLPWELTNKEIETIYMQQ